LTTSELPLMKLTGASRCIRVADRHHQQAVLHRRQAIQRGDALADDFGVRAERVVGQGFPVGEVQHRQIAGEHRELGFQRLRVEAVAGDRDQQAAVAAGGFGDGQRQCAGTGRCPPVGALLAGGREGGREQGDAVCGVVQVRFRVWAGRGNAR
jgi:hypothetical protein